MKYYLFRIFIPTLFTYLSISIATSQAISDRDSPLISIPLITTYTPSEYYGGVQNWGIAQDTTGYLYVANNFGLLEFDGAKWRRYVVPSGTKSRCVQVHSTTNKIYIGGQGQLGFFSKSIEGLSYTNLISNIPKEVPIDEVWDLIEYNGRIYANITGHLVVIQDSVINHFEGIDNIDFLTNLGGTPVAASSKGLYIYNNANGNFERQKNSEGFEYRGIVNTKNGYLIFTYNGFVFRYENNKLNQVTLPIKEELKINKVLQLNDGKIVIGTQNDGLYILNENLVPLKHLTKNKGLNHRAVLSLYEDGFNSLWVGLNNGICVVELGSPFSLINEDVDLEGTGYTAGLFNNKAYLGTSSGLFTIEQVNPAPFPTYGYKVLERSEGLVYNISLVDENIIVSHHEGSFLLKGLDQIHQFFEGTGSWDFKSYHNKFLGGTYKGFYLFDKQNGTIGEGKKLTGLNESSRVFEFENDTVLWMTHGYKGAYRILLKNDSIAKITHYGSQNGFPSDILISVYKIANELVFTGESGVYTYDKEGDRFEGHPFLNDWFQNKHVSQIEQDQLGNIYYIADKEVGVLKRKSIGMYVQQEKQFRKIKEYLSNDLENINVLSSSEVLFGAKEGFIRYQLELDNIQARNFQVFLREATFSFEGDSTKTIVGDFFNSTRVRRPRVIHFEYAAPFFDGIEAIKFSYRLKPYSNHWSEWSSTNWKEFTNLSSGDYTLEIKAKNIYGDESQVSTYSFSITPFWYESKTAYGIYSGFFIILLAAFFYRREKKHHSEKQNIHKIKDEAIRTKEREIDEFSKKSSQEIQQLRNESLKKEIGHKNNQLASVTMHLLSKNEFVESVRKKLKGLLDKADKKEYLLKIIKDIDSNIKEEESWETFEHYFDQVHGNFLHKIKKELKLTPQETKLCAYLKMNMSTKDIANLMNITVRGVELARYRLRKKLGITRETNLSQYLEAFE